ncbi:MAG: hypothetical protein JXQ75_06130 [Phycisphaerae bacterium]|nr:hypothetical protein [Phycisphaerae bacterium]
MYPAHVAGVDPAEPNYFGSLTIDDVIAEIEGAGLAFDQRICGTLSHEEGLAQGCVFNFRK